jgi:ABC-type transport system substrate-binding protein
MKKITEEKNMKKDLLCLLLALSLAGTTLAGCSSSQEAGQSGQGNQVSNPNDMNSTVIGDAGAGAAETGKRYDHITIALKDDWGNMQPINAHVGTRDLVLTNIYEPLFEYDPSQEGMEMYRPLLASGYEKVTVDGWDGDVYDVKLYDYIHDTENNPITADDVVFCYDYYFGGSYTTKSSMLEKWEKVDDYTVRFFFNKPIDSLGELEYPWCRYPIVDESVMDRCVTDPVGTGVYKVKEWTSGAYIVFEANDDYWQKDELISPLYQRNVQEIEYRVISEASSQVVELQTNALDYSEYVPTENLPDFMDGGAYSSRYQVAQMARDYTTLLVPSQSENSICKDVNMRLAIYYAINNDALEIALGGTALAAQTLGSPRFPDCYIDEWSQMQTYINTYDLEKSAQYLQAAGYDGQTLVMSYDSSRSTWAEVIQNMLDIAGIKVKLSANDSSTSAQTRADYDSWDLRLDGFGGTFLIGGWNKYMNPDDNGTGYNVGGYRDEDFYSLFKAAYSLDGHNYENMTKIVEYMTDESHAYFDALTYTCLSVVYNSDAFNSLYYREGGYLMPGACTYNVE